MKHPLILVAASLTALLSGCVAGESEDIGSAQQEIVGGTINRADPAVVAILSNYEGGGQALCTGTLIAPDVVLTAAHCLTGQAPQSRIVFFGSNLQQGTNDPDFIETINAIDYTYDTAFNLENLAAGHDIGMIRLERDSTVTPMGINRTAPAVGQPIRLTGFGRIEGVPRDGTADNGGGAGIKREVSSSIRTFADAFGENITPPDLVAYGSTVSNTCQGDSGGPNFVTIGGVEYVAGITSFGDIDCGLAGAGTRVDRYVDYITAYAGNAVAACIDDGICEGNCATPDPDCAADQCQADNQCTEICGAQDPDCAGGGASGGDGGSKGISGGCSSTGGNMPSGFLAFLLAMGLVTLRRFTY